ncbi:DUF3574 domain-containing protein [Halomicronema sp. CCY15110]|uniref:DUF3574 domain-containing protein n=1 Tax=Halomicronema sp. CCY15110 TaxID=2767773 RepID=UPI00194DD8AC|nr:DUF3574 domain-containing protein [Halomicronema sp. CCY15110]
MQWFLNTVNVGYRHSVVGLTALLFGMGGGTVQAQTPDLIENNLLAELIQVDLYLGRQISDGDIVSDADFETFIDTEVTPRFPNGLTVWKANGRYQDASGTVIAEPSNVVRLIFLDTQANETALMEVIQAYIAQFEQETVMVLVDEDVTVEFVPALDPPPVPAIFSE